MPEVRRGDAGTAERGNEEGRVAKGNKGSDEAEVVDPDAL